MEGSRHAVEPKDSNLSGTPQDSNTQGPRDSGTLTTKDLYTQNPRLVDTIGGALLVLGWGAWIRNLGPLGL